MYHACGVFCMQAYCTSHISWFQGRLFPVFLQCVCLSMPSDIPTCCSYHFLHYIIKCSNFCVSKGSQFIASSVSVSILPCSFLGPRFVVMVIFPVPQIKWSSCTRDKQEGLNVFKKLCFNSFCAFVKLVEKPHLHYIVAVQQLGCQFFCFSDLKTWDLV